MRAILLFLLFSVSSALAQTTIPLRGSRPAGSLPVKVWQPVGPPSASKRIGVVVTINGKLNFPARVRTSVGVFTKGGQSVRTLWQNVDTVGVFPVTWDGLGDDGNTVASGSYDIKAVSSNVQYDWQGVLGNTSYTGPNSYSTGLHGNYHYPFDLLVTGGKAFRADHYAEGPSAVNSFPVASPQIETELYPRETSLAIDHLATDGTRLYAAGYDMDESPNDGLKSKNSGVRCTNVSSGAYVSFSSGTNYTPIHGGTLSLASFKSDTTYRITGLAVQPSGNYLFVAYRAKNMVRVLDKISGALVSEQTISTPARMVCDGSGSLWLISGTAVQKRTVASDGTISSASITLSGTVLPLALGLSTDYGTIAVCDGGSSQQVKAYAASDGSAQWTKGTAGGYLSDPTVTTDKFYFNDASNGIRGGYIAFHTDGSFLVGDLGNYRTLHYNADRSFKQAIAWLPNNYSPYVDQNNATRVFAQYLEYQVDYSKPNLTDAGAWTLVRNWRTSVPAAHFNLTNLRQNIFLTGALKNVATLGNGRTYALTYRPDQKYVLVELPSSGQLRVSSIVLSGQVQLLADGSLMRSVKNGMAMSWQKQALTGFDANGWPQWAAAANYATIGTLTTNDPIDWTGYGNDVAIDVDGRLISFDKNLLIGGGGAGYHLGAVVPGGNQWLWRNAMATRIDYRGDYPTDGRYDLGNGVTYGGGDLINAVGNNIFWDYRGEFWKQPAQTNYWHHVDSRTGLSIGQFGNSSYAAARTGDYSGMAGNVFYGQVVIGPDGNAYAYHGEESGWHGVHRWRIRGLNTIQIQTIQAIVSAPTTVGTDLLAGLPRQSYVPSAGVAGWSFTGAPDSTSEFGGRFWRLRTSLRSYDKFKSPDIWLQFRKDSVTYTATRTLPVTTSLSSWNLSGVLNLVAGWGNDGQISDAISGGWYMDLLDNTGKVITRFYQMRYTGVSPSLARVYVNSTKIAEANEFGGELSKMAVNQPISITRNASGVQFTYAGYSASNLAVFESGADNTRPAQIKFTFWNKNASVSRDRYINIQSLRWLAQ